MAIINPQLAVMTKMAKTDAQKFQVIERFFDEIGRRVEDAITEQKHLILWGEPGSSKSSIVKNVIKGFPSVQVHKNKVSPVQLFEILYNNRAKGQVLVLDDCDSWFDDKDCHSTLMAATDSDPEAMVHWNSNSDLLKRKGIPASFQFQGTVIVVTNKLMIERAESIKPQDIKINQIVSRMNSFCVNMPDNTWNMLTIKLWHQHNLIQCFGEHNMTADEQADIINFLDENKDSIKRLSFRTVAQCCKTMRSRGADDWRFSAMFDLV